jgi:carbamoyltransferase
MRHIRKWTSGRGSDSFFSGTDSIGSPYWFLSQLMFAKEHQESKVMGLASYGKQKERFSNIYSYKDLGEVEISNQWIFDLNDIPKNDLMNNFDLYADIAYTIQNQFEYAITHKANWLFEQVKSENLIFSGGVALNCVANSYLYHNSIFKNIYVPFGAGDSSISIGCAYYGISVLLGDDFKPNETISSPYLGKEYTKNEISRAIDKFKHFIEYENKYTLKKIAEFINQNKLIAFVHGRSEFGPRALGNRSLLASPKNPEARNLINSKVKYRESYRPFAPVVLFEFAAEYFDDIVPNSYHMQFIATVKEAKRHLLPAITHVDNTARIQLLKREHNKDLYDLIVEFYKISGVPILLNTSFNW